MAKKTPAATDNAQDSAQKQSEAAIAPQAESAPQADSSTLPFAQKREELIKKFRANAVPREADYKLLLDQHYDVAGALGMANSEDNNGGNTGKGLVFESKKLHVKAKEKGGLLSDTNGVSLVTGSSLVIGTDNKVNVNISGTNGLTTLANGEVGVKLHSNNIDSDTDSAAVIACNPQSTSGLWINVGYREYKKGLQQYHGSSALSAVLGVRHDDTLQITKTSGRLGVKLYSAGGLVSSGSGLRVNTIETSGLKLEGNALKIDTGSSLVIGTDNKVNVKVSGANGLTTSSDGQVKVFLRSDNADGLDRYAAVMKHNVYGISVHVGKDSEKKGLQQYQDRSGIGAVLGVCHDYTLKIDSTSGRLGVNMSQLPVTGVSSPLTLNNGVVGFSKDRIDAIKLYGRFLDADLYDFSTKYIFFTKRTYFIFIASVYYLNEFDSVDVPDRYKHFSVRNITSGDNEFRTFVYSGGVFSGLMPKGRNFASGDRIAFKGKNEEIIFTLKTI